MTAMWASCSCGRHVHVGVMWASCGQMTGTSACGHAMARRAPAAAAARRVRGRAPPRARRCAATPRAPPSTTPTAARAALAGHVVTWRQAHAR
eukprot:5711632-Prymnesium_polylepis.1